MAALIHVIDVVLMHLVDEQLLRSDEQGQGTEPSIIEEKVEKLWTDAKEALLLVTSSSLRAGAHGSRRSFCPCVVSTRAAPPVQVRRISARNLGSHAARARC
jgi:hypothetical protein